MNDLYNPYKVRDAWWENKTGPLTTLYRQSDRGLGPINRIPYWRRRQSPDTTWAFGFANLEQSRIPNGWCIRY